MYEKIRKYYESGLWSEGRVRKAVELGKLSAGEYEAITGLKY
ncbi:MAG: XkdX family protein [Synergistaceae bacterium]|nr:XkdX family protein [Synergistaceae bacterium]